MASVKSLGLHQPAGLPYAIEEQLLPENPPSNSYTWDISTDEHEGIGVQDELLTTERCVIWCRGGIFRKTFRFDLEKENITQALLAYFPTSEDDKSETLSKPKKGNTSLAKALVVFLKTQAHIYFLAGASHVVHIPFEVESAFAGPVGVIIQRRQRDENSAPISFKFPRVPPNSFVSSQLTVLNSSQQTVFSVEGLNKPKPLRLSSTLDNLWEPPLEHPDSRWPRLVSLTDPLMELGLVVTDQEPQKTNGLRRNAAKKPPFLDPAEEILHIEEIKIPGASGHDLHQPLIIGITVNLETSNYTVWRLTYLKHEDPFINRQKSPKGKAARRRSSMQPGFASGPSTPVQANLRESFGAPLPGKRQRKSEKFEKPLDLVSSLEQQDKEGKGATRRSSRRVSSMLARADLSASHERSVFADQSLLVGHAGTKRHDSQGSHRLSANFSQQVHPSVSSLLEAPFDVGLDEGFCNMGLDDHDFDGLQHEIVFTRLTTVSMDNSNLRYSTNDKPASDQSKVFILTAPPFAIDGYNRSQITIGIQDAAEKRLQLITLALGIQHKVDLAAKAARKEVSEEPTVSVTVVDLRRAQNVVDSCKLVDGDHSAILILSESMDGRHELSTQAPWSELTKISLPLLFVDSTKSLQFRGRAIDRDVKQRKSEIIDISSGSIVGVRHPRQRGVVDVVDAEGRLHQILVQLEPRCPQVRKILAVCRSILPQSLGERVCAGWLHSMQWLQEQEQNQPIADMEWSAMVILLLASFLSLDGKEIKTTSKTQPSMRKSRSAQRLSGSLRDSPDWKALEAGETANSLGFPAWMMNRGWEWVLDEEVDDTMPPPDDHSLFPRFITRHIDLAKRYMASPLGTGAFGSSGYMPTAHSKNMESRRKVAVDLFLGLHLLLEEQKLDIMTPEFVPSGRVDLRVVLCQMARWLRWQSFTAIYEAGIQEDQDYRRASGTRLQNTSKIIY